jgi:hypothetical protein
LGLAEFNYLGFADDKIRKSKIGCSERIAFKYVITITRNRRVKSKGELNIFNDQIIIANQNPEPNLRIYTAVFETGILVTQHSERTIYIRAKSESKPVPGGV